MRSDNTHHLLAAAQRRRDSTIERAQRTLQKLSETGQRYTVTDPQFRAFVAGLGAEGRATGKVHDGRSFYTTGDRALAPSTG